MATQVFLDPAAGVDSNAGLLCFFVLHTDQSLNGNQHIYGLGYLPKVSFFDFFLLLSLFFLLSPSLRFDYAN